MRCRVAVKESRGQETEVTFLGLKIFRTGVQPEQSKTDQNFLATPPLSSLNVRTPVKGSRECLRSSQSALTDLRRDAEGREEMAQVESFLFGFGDGKGGRRPRFLPGSLL
uniref:Uncharacterized protein n=1 Tax=Chromera velia CCMP2878 TaxID=1169474 RepID=A0A0G4F5R6_9ALVE|eukprot:Cvel_15311.t1-p1 / transcript=Cvel_15311.t1 / gene=Cvel_15311 / organism=Chromera_velia_CCMP2878 / gene_product=hypothetical protein / transcript_product=hypothetical protein / location=Cvel_scaffold1125:16367-31911(+) / protein_length=109 / sequence_SO=supercontig / SO=protein_coding / is_pseudo=false